MVRPRSLSLTLAHLGHLFSRSHTHSSPYVTHTPFFRICIQGAFAYFGVQMLREASAAAATATECGREAESDAAKALAKSSGVWV